MFFYSAAALLAVQSTVIAITFPSVRHVSVFVQRNEDTIMLSSVSGSGMVLVSGEVKFTWTFTGDDPQRGH